MTKKPSARAAAPKATPKKASAPAGVDVAQLQVLADWLTGSALEEIEIEAKGLRVRLKKPGAYSAGVSMAPVMTAPAPTTRTAEPASAKNVFQAPMVGTFYTASSPDAAAFVKVGDTVRAGQTLCIIEAMKTMNQIASDRAGTVREVLAKNAQPVEYGQPLFVIE